MTKRLICQGKLEESVGEYSSGMILHHDFIMKVMDKWGAAAQPEIYMEEEAM